MREMTHKIIVTCQKIFIASRVKFIYNDFEVGAKYKENTREILMLLNDLHRLNIHITYRQYAVHAAKKIACYSILLFFWISLTGCGVKTVGGDVQPHIPSGLEKAAYDPIDARYPAFNTRNERRLYTLNHPKYFRAQQEQVNASLRSTFTKASGTKKIISTDETDNIIDFDTHLNDQPKSISPFR